MPEAVQLSTTPLTSSYRPDIDGLRAVAVIAVLIYHVDNKLLPGGFMGVDIFFAISGFVVTLSLLRRPKHKDTKMSDYLLQFYKRRLMRLAPSLILCLLATVLLMTFLIPPWWPNKMDWYVTGAYSVFGMSNLQLAFQESNKGYFDINGDPNLNPFLHTWSLGVEEQFYLIYPIILAIGTSSSCQVHTLLILFAVVSLMLSCVLAFTVKQQIGFYFSPARFWEMAAGGCSVLVMQCYEDTFKRMNGMVSLLFDLMVIGILATTFAFGHTLWPYSPFPFPLAFLPVLATCLFMCLGSSERNVTNLLLSKKPAVYIGKLSYGLYLVHWPLFVILRFHVDFQNSWVLFALVLSFILACLMHHGIEKNCKSKGMQPKKLFVLLILVQIVMALFVVWPVDPPNNVHNATVSPLNASAIDNHSCACRYESDEKEVPFHRPINVSPDAEKFCYVTKSRFETLYPGRMYQGQKAYNYASRDPAAHAQSSMKLFFGATESAPAVSEFKAACKQILMKNRKPNNPHIFLLGDSMALQIHLPLVLATQGMYTLSNLNAEAIDQAILFSASNGMTYINALFDTIAEMMTSNKDIVVITFHYNKLWSRLPLLKAVQAARERILLNATLIIVDTVLMLPQNGYEYLQPKNQNFIGLPQQTLGEGVRGAFFKPLLSFANANSNTYFFNIADKFCHNNRCLPWIPGTETLAYWDRYHLTPAASFYLWPFFCEQFKEVGLLSRPTPKSPGSPGSRQSPVDDADAFPLDPNESVDTDLDLTGDNADTDDDDGVGDDADAFPLDPNESVDTDLDGTGSRQYTVLQHGSKGVIVVLAADVATVQREPYYQSIGPYLPEYTVVTFTLPDHAPGYTVAPLTAWAQRGSMVEVVAATNAMLTTIKKDFTQQPFIVSGISRGGYLAAMYPDADYYFLFAPVLDWLQLREWKDIPNHPPEALWKFQKDAKYYVYSSTNDERVNGAVVIEYVEENCLGCILKQGTSGHSVPSSEDENIFLDSLALLQPN